MYASTSNNNTITGWEQAEWVEVMEMHPMLLFPPRPVLELIIMAFVTYQVFKMIIRRYLSPISHIPGPDQASMTRLWYIFEILEGKLNEHLVDLHEEHGHFVRIAPNEVSVSHPSALKALYRKPVAKGKWYKIQSFPSSHFPTALSILDPHRKADFTRYISHADFNPLQHEDTIDVLFTKLKGWMDRYAALHNPMDLSSFLTFTALDVLGALTFSKPLGFLEQGRDIGGAIATHTGVQSLFCILGQYRWLAWLLHNPLATWVGVLPAGDLVGMARDALKERAGEMDSGAAGRGDLVGGWVSGVERARTEKEEGGKGVREGCVLSAAVATLGIGSDTVSCGVQTAIYHLLQRPEMWNRLRNEIIAVQRKGLCLGSVVRYDDAAQLPYLDACIKEALRIVAPIPFPLPRVAPKEGITIRNTFFPGGTVLSVSPTVMHLSKKIWGDDAREYNPDRWFADDIARKEKYFMPWGLGWAACPAQLLSKVLMYKLVATIVRDYDFKLAEPKKSWQWTAFFTLNPTGWPVYITKRK